MPLHPALQKLNGRYLLALTMTGVVSFVILLAIWVAAAAIVENIKFGKATDQILDIMTSARTLAVRDPAFAQQTSEDAMLRLTGAGLLRPEPTGPAFHNPWKFDIRAVTTGASQMRLETTVPVHECRRIAHFFLDNAKELGLKGGEAMTNPQSLPRRFYSDPPARMPSAEEVAAACEDRFTVVLALTFNLR
jgi:hypothetical protein